MKRIFQLAIALIFLAGCGVNSGSGLTLNSQSTAGSSDPNGTNNNNNNNSAPASINLLASVVSPPAAGSCLTFTPAASYEVEFELCAPSNDSLGYICGNSGGIVQATAIPGTTLQVQLPAGQYLVNFMALNSGNSFTVSPGDVGLVYGTPSPLVFTVTAGQVQQVDVSLGCAQSVRPRAGG